MLIIFLGLIIVGVEKHECDEEVKYIETRPV